MLASPLDNPDHAAHAWARFRRLLVWNLIASAFAALLGLIVLRWLAGPVPWFMALMTVVGIFATVACAALLMGLVFMSAGTGHDASIEDPFADDHL